MLAIHLISHGNSNLKDMYHRFLIHPVYGEYTNNYFLTNHHFNTQIVLFSFCTLALYSIFAAKQQSITKS